MDMSLPPKALTVSGPPPSQLRLNPGPGAAPQPQGAQPQPQPQPQIPRVPLSLEERIFPAQPGVTAIYGVPRHPASPYQGHDLSKGLPSSPAMSQVSAPPPATYRYLKGWESGGLSPYAPTPNAASASLIYASQTQPLNVQPPSRPFVTGPRPTHHQFLPRAQMQATRPALPTNSASLRPGSQGSATAVYPTNPPVMMTMTPVPFPSAQAAQYFIPQYRQAPPFVGPPQQFSVPPPASGTFYPGPGPGEYPAHYAAAPGAYFTGQAVYPSSASFIVPTPPQQPPPAKREKKPIRIRDPNQGGKDITEEIMAGSGNTTPPIIRPSSTPTPPQQRSARQTPDQLYYSMDPPYRLSPAPMDNKPSPDLKPRASMSPVESSSPEPLSSPAEHRQPRTSPSDSSETKSADGLPLSNGKLQDLEEAEEICTAPADRSLSPALGAKQTPETSSCSIQASLPKNTENGTAHSPLHSSACDPEFPVQETPAAPLDSPPSSRRRPEESEDTDSAELSAPVTHTSPPEMTFISSKSQSALAPPPGLTVGLSCSNDIHRISRVTESNNLPPKTDTKTPHSDLCVDADRPVSSAAAQDFSVLSNGCKTPTEDGVDLEGHHTEEEADIDDSVRDEVPPAASETNNHLSSERRCTVEENGEMETELLNDEEKHDFDSESLTVSPEVRNGSTEAAVSEQEVLIHPNGKIQYDRDFLLSFQFTAACVLKPESLPPISDVVLDKINQIKVPLRTLDPRLLNRGPDFTPAFADFSRQLLGARSPLISITPRRLPPRKVIMNVSVNVEVQLKKAENAWKPAMKRELLPEDQEAQKTLDLFRKVRSILNKLTPQMFSQLMKQVTALTINTEERLKGVIDLVFEKALDEPGFSVAYANMCHCLAALKVPMTDKPGTTVNFRKLLLNRCQKEFEKDKMDDAAFEKRQKELESAASAAEKEQLQEELEEAKDKARRRSTGNIKFIGELFKLRMLTEAIMHDCVVKLLKNHDDESLECLCRLLTTIGRDLDFEKAKPRMDQYFTQMEKIVKERKTSSRIRFMVQDVIDLRLHNWVSRRADQGPKTIEQIHKEARIEEQEEQRKVQHQLLSKDNRRRPDSREQRGLRDDNWSTVPMTKSSRTIDPSKIPKISKSQIDDKIQLGPRAQLNWVKGSSGGAKASNSDMPLLDSSNLNRFSALQSSTFPSSQTCEADPKTPPASIDSCNRDRNEKALNSGPSKILNHSVVNKMVESLTPEETSRDTELTANNVSVSEDSSKTAQSPAKQPTVKCESQTKAVLSEEEMERKSKSIIDEFLHINDFKEAVQCVEELEQEAQLEAFVRVGVESTLERSHVAREHMGQLLYQLILRKSLPCAQLYAGLADTLEMADDMAIDIPHIWLYLAELLCPLLKEGGIPMKDLFTELSKTLIPVGKAGILFAEILNQLCKQMSHREVGALWRAAGLNWSAFLSDEQELQNFISEQKLHFTLSDSPSVLCAPSNPNLSQTELYGQLQHLLLENMASEEEIFDWVEANLDEAQIGSSPFLRALMTAVCKAAVSDENTSCKVDTTIIKKHLPVLHKYFHSDAERQLQALYALQELILTLDQPPNLLRMFFDCLYDEDVISEDAFYRWETSSDPAEQQGKDAALTSVAAFFTWLREAEEESEEN